jgi:hypothetical protein
MVVFWQISGNFFEKIWQLSGKFLATFLATFFATSCYNFFCLKFISVNLLLEIDCWKLLAIY